MCLSQEHLETPTDLHTLHRPPSLLHPHGGSDTFPPSCLHSSPPSPPALIHKCHQMTTTPMIHLTWCLCLPQLHGLGVTPHSQRRVYFRVRVNPPVSSQKPTQTVRIWSSGTRSRWLQLEPRSSQKNKQNFWTERSDRREFGKSLDCFYLSH